MKRRVFLTFCFVLAGFSQAALAQSDPTADLLRISQAARLALAQLGSPDGYSSRPDVRIGLHKNLARAESLLRTFGLGPQVDGLVQASNRTAELAMRDASGQLVKQFEQLITAGDAANLLNLDQAAAAVWLQERSDARLTELLQPIVHKAAGEADLERAYEALYRALQTFTKGESNAATVENYITRQALAGLYKRLAATLHIQPQSAAALR